MAQEINKLLIRSFDNDLSLEEREQLEDALKSSPELQEEKQQLVKIRAMLGRQEYIFKPKFAERVMDRINELNGGLDIRTDFTRELSLTFKRVALSGAAAILILLVISYFSEGSLSFDSLMGLGSLNADNLIMFLVYDF